MPLIGKIITTVIKTTPIAASPTYPISKQMDNHLINEKVSIYLTYTLKKALVS